MADQERINSILYKLQKQVTLSADETKDLQAHVDNLEKLGPRFADDHRETHSTHYTKETHHSFFHTKSLEVAGILEEVAQKQITRKEQNT